MSRKFLSVLMGVGMMLATASQLRAADLQWSGKLCATLDGNFYFCKPDDKWDTQKTEETLRPVKLVYHKGGSNPIIWLIYDDMSSASNPADYASDVRARYESRGIRVDAVIKETVGGKSVYIVSGYDSGKDARFSTALFWRSGVKRILQAEYTAASSDFSTYQPQFMGFVSTVRDLR